MPLTDRDYYTWGEALARLRERLPADDPAENLLTALQSNDYEYPLTARIHDQTTNAEVELSSPYWVFAKPFDSTCDFLSPIYYAYDAKTGVAASPRSEREVGNGQWTDRKTRGAIRIDRAQFDRFLDKFAPAIGHDEGNQKQSPYELLMAGEGDGTDNVDAKSRIAAKTSRRLGRKSKSLKKFAHWNERALEIKEDKKYQRQLRVRPETLCRITEFSEHESNGRELDEGERVAVEVLPVLGQSAAAVEPGDGAFDHPTPGLDDEAENAGAIIPH